MRKKRRKRDCFTSRMSTDLAMSCAQNILCSRSESFVHLGWGWILIRMSNYFSQTDGGESNWGLFSRTWTSATILIPSNFSIKRKKKMWNSEKDFFLTIKCFRLESASTWFGFLWRRDLLLLWKDVVRNKNVSFHLHPKQQSTSCSSLLMSNFNLKDSLYFQINPTIENTNST